MGAQIAHQAALHGFAVTLCGRDSGRLAQAAAAAAILRRRVEKGKLEPSRFEATLGRVVLTCDPEYLKVCEVIIESVVEDRDIKRSVLMDISVHADPEAIIATNSSTLPSSMFADVVRHPRRLCNLHFFNPALAMPLVEVVRGSHTAESTVEAAVAFAQSIGKIAVRVERESYGFLANRMLFMAMREAFTLVEDGYVSIEGCDNAVKGALGWAMGPFELADLIGLDVTEAILREGAAQTGEARWSPPASLVALVKRGHLGRKTGRGFTVGG